MTTEKKTNPNRPPRKRATRAALQEPRTRLAARAAGSAIVQATSSIDELKARTWTRCAENFERRWGRPWLTTHTERAGDVPERLTVEEDRGLARLFGGFWDADRDNRAMERDCAALYEHVRTGDLEALELAYALLTAKHPTTGTAYHPDGSGGVAAAMLRVLFATGVSANASLPDLATLANEWPQLDVGQKDGRSEFVARFSGPVAWLGGAVLTNREMAEILILCEMAPSDYTWASYARALRTGDVRPERVVDDEEDRVRRVRDPIGSV